MRSDVTATLVCAVPIRDLGMEVVRPTPQAKAWGFYEKESQEHIFAMMFPNRFL